MDTISETEAHELTNAIRDLQEKLRSVLGDVMDVDNMRVAESEEASRELHIARRRGIHLRSLLGGLDNYLFWSRVDPYSVVPQTVPRAHFSVDLIKVLTWHLEAAGGLIRDLDTLVSGSRTVADAEDKDATAQQLSDLRKAHRSLQETWRVKGMDGMVILQEKDRGRDIG